MAARASVGPLHQEYWGIWNRKAGEFHWFGTYTGTLPGGIELREAYGVRERHDALWWNMAVKTQRSVMKSVP